ncbi:nucleotidyltransferase domain-containing protein [Synechococcus lacustris L1E-Slac]|uniref:Nucleotidyltransferase domain-containing protein n=1 Tax=Synechococcus lacustris str. Tous TaxID=1910958 RepID=A0A2P7EAB4_9SYNE|nr:nucleotidyltransferase domain-containing protein [Synechococcus lacustris L1F-Slac]MCP9814066.1 nucleotidyltransferase domain-containing protein [Synechococcus lacustris L1E-Slac]PSI00166.1 nucleotidyltransferase domain-containing protein [Synechococcus lacustris str. Tous]
MVASTQHTFKPPAIPWLKPQHLLLTPDLAIGLDYGLFAAAMERLSADPAVHALIVFGSRGRGEAKFDSDLDLAVVIRQAQLTPAEKASHWRHFRQLIGPLGVGLDLVLAGISDAEKLSQSRWHVFGDVARQGRVLYVTR